MSGHEGPQQSHYLGEPQALDSGGNCSSAGWSSGLHKCRCPQGLSTGTPHQGKQQDTGHQHPQRQIQVQENAIWSKMSQDVFQMMMDLIMEKCPGVISIHNDIVIYGTSEEDHDSNLINVPQLKGLVLNSKNLELKRPRVSFFGAEYSTGGMHPCLKKIQGITEMTPPIDQQQLASFIGMVTYMGNFVPHLSHHMEPLIAMLKQDAVFHWDQMANDSFQKIKDLIAKMASQPLRYYDRTKPLVVQADASQRGLGAFLLQEGQLIAFASKSLRH